MSNICGVHKLDGTICGRTDHDAKQHSYKPESKATGTNPKDIFGKQKLSFTKFPFVALMHGALAMMNGAHKYGAYNWRDKEVVASIYVDAAMRHLAAWFECQETADDSGVHHLGHALACIAILLDAQEHGKLVDDRPGQVDHQVIPALMERLAKVAGSWPPVERKVS